MVAQEMSTYWGFQVGLARTMATRCVPLLQLLLRARPSSGNSHPASPGEMRAVAARGGAHDAGDVALRDHDLTAT